MDDYKVLNSDGLRYDDEFCQAKILDAMGDLYLIGKRCWLPIQRVRSGHAMNNLLRELWPSAMRGKWSCVRGRAPGSPRALLSLRAW